MTSHPGKWQGTEEYSMSPRAPGSIMVHLKLAIMNLK